MKHGGDLLSYEKYYDGDLIDYSSNINPLGPPLGLEDHLSTSYKNLSIYPDIKYRHLKKSISTYLKCQTKNIILGNGAVELIDNLIYLAQRVLVFLPSFLEYEKRAQIQGKEIVYINYSEDFTIDIKEIERKIKKGDLLILGNPNNPTGLRIDQVKLREIYQLTRKINAFLVLDEAFFEFCPKDYDSIEVFKDYEYESLAIIRAATKFFGLPGIRLGYGCTSKKIAKEIENIQLPWSINSYAEASSKVIFSDDKYIRESKAFMENERNFIQEELFKLKKIKIYPSETNFILIKLLKFDEDFVFNYFLERGILIRKCSSFRGLDNTYIRIAIKTRKENTKLLNIFMELENE